MDFPILWCGVVALLFIALLSTRISRAGITRRTSQLPPLVNGISLLAELPTLLMKGLPSVVNDLYVQYGSVCMVSFFGLNVTLVMGPEVTAHFFQGSDSEISKGNLGEFSVPMFGTAIGHARGRAIRNEQKRFYSEALKTSRLTTHVSPMLQEVEIYVSQTWQHDVEKPKLWINFDILEKRKTTMDYRSFFWEKNYFAKWGKEGIVDLKHEFDQLLMLISIRCLVGKEVRENMFDEANTLFAELGNGLNLISFFYPYLPTPANRQRDRARIRLTEIISDVVEFRKRSGRVEEDTLQRLIDSKYNDGSSTTVPEVVGLIMALLFTGKHTSTHTSTWIGACLLSHPSLLRAAVEEQEQISKKYKDGLDHNAILEMATLHNCIKEARRMHPPMPILVRKAHKDFTVQTREGKQYEIPQDHFLACPTIVNNYIPYIYKDPQVYDPYRFCHEREEDKVGGKFSYTSFGGGRNACIGEAYAYMQIKVIWSHLLRNFEFELISPFPKTDWNKYVAEPKGNVFVRYRRTAILQSLN